MKTNKHEFISHIKEKIKNIFSKSAQHKDDKLTINQKEDGQNLTFEICTLKEGGSEAGKSLAILTLSCDLMNDYFLNKDKYKSDKAERKLEEYLKNKIEKMSHGETKMSKSPEQWKFTLEEEYQGYRKAA